MKSVSENVRLTEIGTEKKPVELFYFWTIDTFEAKRYTNHDERVFYNGYYYEPAAIRRGSVMFDSTLEVSTLDIMIDAVSEPIRDHIIDNPVDESWVQVSRVLRGIGTTEASVVFIGQVKDVAFAEGSAAVKCVGFEDYLRMPIPKFRYQPQCNWSLFDTRCGVSPPSFMFEDVAISSVNESETIINAPLFGYRDDGWWIFGWINWNNQRRMVIAHNDTEIILRYPLRGIKAGDQVTIYAGCERTIEVCRDKFDNVDNFGGHPYIPRDNPVLWSG